MRQRQSPLFGHMRREQKLELCLGDSELIQLLELTASSSVLNFCTLPLCNDKLLNVQLPSESQTSVKTGHCYDVL